MTKHYTQIGHDFNYIKCAKILKKKRGENGGSLKQFKGVAMEENNKQQ